MTVEVKRTLIIRKPDGGEIVVGPEDKIEQRQVIVEKNGGFIVLQGDEKVVSAETAVKMTCDGPKCMARTDNPTPVTVEWIEEQVGQKPDALPDAFARFIKGTVDPFEPKEYAFCGPRCNKDFLDYAYVPAKSPREKAAAMAARMATLTPDSPGAILPECAQQAEAQTKSSAGVLDQEALKKGFLPPEESLSPPEPVTQADGFAPEAGIE